MIIIHACKSRLWYVDNFLVPMLEDRGCKDVKVWLDENGAGNLISCMECFKWCGTLQENNSWHLQDDVLPSSKFKSTTDNLENYDGIIDGFICEISGNHLRTGEQKYDGAWYSFPCIRIPNKIAGECAEWFYHSARSNPKYKKWVEAGKYDDTFFKEFMEQFYPDAKYLNLVPNLVEHIDYLIGGSIVNKTRKNETSSCYWYEPTLTQRTKMKIMNFLRGGKI